jgi:hypothetical protein
VSDGCGEHLVCSSRRVLLQHSVAKENSFEAVRGEDMNRQNGKFKERLLRSFSRCCAACFSGLTEASWFPRRCVELRRFTAKISQTVENDREKFSVCAFWNFSGAAAWMSEEALLNHVKRGIP